MVELLFAFNRKYLSSEKHLWIDMDDIPSELIYSYLGCDFGAQRRFLERKDDIPSLELIGRMGIPA